jgi:hypothetical protein
MPLVKTLLNRLINCLSNHKHRTQGLTQEGSRAAAMTCSEKSICDNALCRFILSGRVLFHPVGFIGYNASGDIA